MEMWTVDLLNGDFAAALLFSQLMWWHQPGKDGRPKVAYERNGHSWLLRADDDWHRDCRLTQKQVRRIRSVLVAKGLVEHRRFKLNGAPTSAWRPLFDAIQEAIRPNPELPSEGQFHGSDPQGAVGSDPQGAVPIPFPPLSNTSGTSHQTRGPHPLPDAFILTDEMRQWHKENCPQVDIRFETRQFAEKHRAKGDKMVRWDLAWRTWMRNADRWRKPAATTPATRNANGYSPSPGADAVMSPADHDAWMDEFEAEQARAKG